MVGKEETVEKMRYEKDEIVEKDERNGQMRLKV
jgi:hypothetical protein